MPRIAFGILQQDSELTYSWVVAFKDMGYEVRKVYQAEELYTIMCEEACDAVVLWDGVMWQDNFQFSDSEKALLSGLVAAAEAWKKGSDVPVLVLNHALIDQQPWLLPDDWKNRPLTFLSEEDFWPSRTVVVLSKVCQK